MSDASWNTYTPAPTRKPSAWLRGLLAVGLVGAAGLGALMLTDLSNRAKAWPVLRSVAVRARTPEGRRDLWNRNPALHRTYPTPEALERDLAPLADRLPEPPAQVPDPAEGHWRVSGDPGGLRAEWQGATGPWIRVRAGLSAPGEGVTELVVAADPEGLAEAHRRFREARFQEDWARLRDLAEALRTDEGARALRRAEPALAAFGDETAFLAWARSVRPHLDPLPERVQDADSDRLVLRRHQGLGGNWSELRFTFKDRSALEARWDQGRLSRVAFTAP